MEPITTAIIGKIIWDNLGQPILDKTKEKYADKLLEKIDNTLSRLPFKKEQLQIIEAEIINTGVEILSSENQFLEFINNNQKIIEILEELNNTKQDINIKVDKGVGYINTMNGDMSF